MIENLWVKKKRFSIETEKNKISDFYLLGSRYVELYFDSPHPSSSSSSTQRRSKSNDTLPRPSRSLSKPRTTDNHSPSRSIDSFL